MKIILCSDHESIRQRWKSILLDRYSTYQASTLEMLRTLATRHGDAVFLVHHPFVDTGTVRELRAMSPTGRIFVFSDAPDKEDGLSWLRMGVVGYANTYISAGRLLEAIRTVSADRVWFGREIISELIQQLNIQAKSSARTASNELLQELTEREREIAMLVAEGLSNQAIGEKLFISERTVKAHLGAIFAKTGASSRLKLALMIRAPGGP
jgi:two-component system, NarL family, nitrate/nitrite response regulator NarL